MLHILKGFIKVVFLSAALASSTFAYAYYGGGCYSPTHIASLYDKPPVDENSIPNLNKRINSKQQQIKTAYKQLNEVEDDLADSLSEEKLKDSPGAAAAAIRDYIEGRQSGWDCFSSSYLESFFLNSPILLEALGAVLMPKALAVEVFTKRDAKIKGGESPSNRQPSFDSARSDDLDLADQEKSSSRRRPPRKNADGAWDLEAQERSSRRRFSPAERRRGDLDLANQERSSGRRLSPEASRTGDLDLANQERSSGRRLSPAAKQTGDLDLANQERSSRSVLALTDEQKKKLCGSRGFKWNQREGLCCQAGEFVINGKCASKAQAAGFSSDEDRCSSAGGRWNAQSGSCQCGDLDVTEQLSGIDSCQEHQCGQEGKIWKQGRCAEQCPGWKNHSGFKKNGRVSSKFCAKYAGDARKCQRNLERLRRISERVAALEDQKEDLEDRIEQKRAENLTGGLLDDTEAGGLCIECLANELKRSQPSAGQQAANALSMLAGVGLGYIGYRTGASADHNSNMLRARQGLPAQPGAYGFYGLNAGYPFLAQGLYGATRASTPAGGWVCTPTAASWNPYSAIHGQGFNIMY